MGYIASLEGLEIVDKARKKKGWTKTMTALWWQEALIARATLRRFWARKAILPENFTGICNAVGVNWKEVVDRSCIVEPQEYQLSKQDLGEAPDVAGFRGRGFYGRTEELSLLEQWIVHDNCRLVALCGIGGIGKTYLAAMLADSIQNKFDYLFWRSLRSSPPLAQILTDLLRFLSPEREHNFTQGINFGVSQLIESLRNNRCLIVLDDFDTVLQKSGDTDSCLLESEDYGELLKRLAETSSKSCLLLVSREKPREIAFREHRNSPVRSHILMDLQLLDAKKILEDKDLLYDSNAWEELIKIYRGHPLALQIVSTFIYESFNRSVAAFLQQNTILVEDKISILLSQQFQRLSTLEKELMYWLALKQQPISILQLQLCIISPINISTLLELLTSLGWRSLIEKTTEDTEVMFSLQPMVMKYVRGEFINQVCSEICQGKIELLRSHALVVEYQLPEQKTEFPYRPIMPKVRDELIKRFGGNRIKLIEHLERMQSIIQDNQEMEKGYSDRNISNLLAELNNSYPNFN